MIGGIREGSMKKKPIAVALAREEHSGAPHKPLLP